MSEELKIPSRESGCLGKTKLGRNYIKEADKLAKKWNRRFTVYRCPHCGGVHMSSKIHKRTEYASEVLHVTSKDLLTKPTPPAP